MFYALLISAENDPLQLRPNPENLISKVRFKQRSFWSFFYMGGLADRKISYTDLMYQLKIHLCYLFLYVI